MAERPRSRQPIRFEGNSGGSEPRRTPPPPRPPIQYTQSGNMKGYEEEYLPPRPVHRPVDNGIEFPSRPSPSRTTAPPPPPRRPARKARPGQAPRKNGAARRNAPETRPGQSPARKEGAKRRKITRAMIRRRRFYRRLTALFLLVAVVAAGAYLTVTMLFKITAIEVQSPDGQVLDQAGAYSSAQVLEVLGLQLEENIFSFRAAEKEEALERQLPLLEQIEVIRRYPGTVVVQVTPAVPTYGLQTSAGWLTLSASLKIIALESQQPALPVLWGGEPTSTLPGTQLSYLAPVESESGQTEPPAEGADLPLQTLQTLLQVLEERGLLASVTRIEFGDAEQLAFLYEDRISVLLGTLNGLDYKMDYAQYLLLNTDGKGCGPTDTGALDCSLLRTDGTLQAIFAQGEPELPSGYQLPEPAPESAAPAQTEAAPEAAPAEGEAAQAPAAPAEEPQPAQQTETNQ